MVRKDSIKVQHIIKDPFGDDEIMQDIGCRLQLRYEPRFYIYSNADDAAQPPSKNFGI